MSLPLLTKRAYDSRLFSVDVTGKLRPGDTVRSFDSLSAQFLTTSDGEGDADLTVSVADTAVSDRDTVLNFTCDGGESGKSYLVVLRYSAQTESQLESVLRVNVL